jgi:predicted O-linked N-acetylglucosamine transferase (SPINDLY family)
MFERLFKSSVERLIARGNQAEKAGRIGEACELYRQAVASAPGDARAHLNLGIALEALGDIAGAMRCHEKALEIDSAEPYASYNLGRLHYTRGAVPQAERLLAQALGSRPDLAEARIVLGCVLAAQGKLEPAAAELEAALRRRPADFGALFHYAGVLGRLRRHEEAQAALERALALEPSNVDARGALADVLQARGDLAGAARELEALLRSRPDWVAALYNYGTTLMGLGREAQAEEALRRVIERAPRFVLAYRMLGSLLHRQGRVDEMLGLCRSALERDGESFELESFELFLLNFSDEIRDEALFARHRSFGARLEAAQPLLFPHRNLMEPERRLRVGYVSGELNSHPVGLFLLPVLERHDRSRFEVCCYSTSTKVDEFTPKLSAPADRWRDVSALSEEQLAETIHADGIDILVDLSGHSGISRLGTFARRPAPVQAAWLGYLNTTGLSRIDYRITDRHTDPPGLTERLHSETLVRLPHSQWCYRPLISVEHAATAPCVRNGYVTFGSFNQAAKISRGTRALWAAILERQADARLLIVGVPPGPWTNQLARDFGSRVTLVPFLPLREYFACFDTVDIALDTMPYSGGTTTCDALWMGVPMITAPGTRPASRSAASILATVGLADWIAPSAEEYVRRALAFSKDSEVLAELRSALRSRTRASPLMDETGFTRDLENLYRRMWRSYCGMQAQ